MHHLVEIWFGWVRDGGYWGIILLMAMESSVIPVPSEVVIPPAAFLAAQGRLSLAGVVLAGTLGSYIGSAISYWVSLWVGRPLIARYGRFFFLSEDKVARAERWLVRYEAGGIFFARLLPVIRHLISIPAGCGVLAYFGKLAYQIRPDLFDASHPEAMVQFIKSQSHLLVIGVAVFAILYLLVLRLTAKPGDGEPDVTGMV